MKKDNIIKPSFAYDEYAKKNLNQSFSRQVLRTLNNSDVDEKQHNLIYKSIIDILQLSKPDSLLEIACGNGYLSKALFSKIESYKGIDISTTLIDVAKANFEKENFLFFSDDAVNYLTNEKNPTNFNKFLCYGSFQLFSDEYLLEILNLIEKRFTKLDKILFANIPNLEKLDEFNAREGKNISSSNLRDPYSLIGKWRTLKEIKNIFNFFNFKVSIIEHNPLFYQSYYRFNLLIEKKSF